MHALKNIYLILNFHLSVFPASIPYNLHLNIIQTQFHEINLSINQIIKLTVLYKYRISKNSMVAAVVAVIKIKKMNT
jgi:hypothetical protein